MKTQLTDLKLKKSLKPKEKAYDVMDAQQRAFGVRVMPSGEKTFILYRRFPGSNSPVRRSLGSYGELSLAEAREKGREWLVKIKKGIDPSQEAKRLQAKAIEAEQAKRTNTLGAAFEIYLKRQASRLRSGPKIQREMSRELKDWMDLPLADITPSLVKATFQAMVDRGVSANANLVFVRTRAFFNWAIDSGDFNLSESPFSKIKPLVLFGPRKVGFRVLNDYEIAAFWRANEAMDYPSGKLYQLLLLTALRLNEAAKAKWSEIDLDSKLWVIPAARMKGGADHSVPLTLDIITLLKSLPRFHGDFLFSTGGQKPIGGFSRTKARLDELMQADLQAQGRQFENFIIHDIRRTCRTQFSMLPMQPIVRELLLAHKQPGLHAVYDKHTYLNEKREALELWHEKLNAIVAKYTDIAA
jgi:integrase